MKKKNPAAVKLGQQGGFVTKRKYGPKHFEDMNKKRWPKCEDCEGTGEILVSRARQNYRTGGIDDEETRKCETCKGTGKK